MDTQDIVDLEAFSSHQDARSLWIIYKSKCTSSSASLCSVWALKATIEQTILQLVILQSPDAAADEMMEEIYARIGTVNRGLAGYLRVLEDLKVLRAYIP